MKTKSHFFRVVNKTITILIAAIPAHSFAAHKQLGADLLNPGDRPSDVVDNGFREATLGIINYILGFLGLLAVAMIIYAGILMVIAQGEEDGVEKAKKIIQWAGIGIIIVLLSYAIVSFFVTAGTSVG